MTTILAAVLFAAVMVALCAAAVWTPASVLDDCGNDCDGPSGHAEGCPVHCGCYDERDES